MAYNNMFSQGFYYNQPNINALEQQLNQLRNMQSQINSPIPNNPQPPMNGVTQIGTYAVVKTLQDMENYAVPVDGTPVNIFIEGSGVFYSKKMNNGVTTCQPFSFAPLNSNSNTENNVTSEETPAWAENLLERVIALEKKANKKPTSKKVIEGEEDGI